MATDTNTYTGNLGAIENKISSLTSAVSQGYSGLPGVTEALRKSLFEREKTLPALERDNESKIQELYTADKRLAERYSNPTSEMFIENPNARQATISGQKSDIRGELGNILNLIQQRGQVLGNALDKGLEMYKAGLEAQKFELEQATQSWERTFKQQQANKKTGSGNNNAAMSALAKLMIGSKSVRTPTEEKPTTDMTDRDPSVEWHSPGGQWQYNASMGDWLPTGTQGSQDFTQELSSLLDAYPELGETVFKNYDEVVGNKKMDDNDLKQQETQELVASLPPAGDSGYDANSLYLQALSQAKYLKSDEIKEILRARGYDIY